MEDANHHVQQQQQLEKLGTRNCQQSVGDYQNMTEAKRLIGFAEGTAASSEMQQGANVELERATGFAMPNRL